MEIRELSDADVRAWAGLLARTFGRDEGDMVRLWHWFRAGPRLIAWGAWDGGRLVAQYSCLQSLLMLPEHPEPFSIGISTNMTVHPDYRGRGLIREVSRPVYQALEDMGALAGVGFSNAAGVRVDRHSKGYGYKVVGQMSNRVMWPPSGSDGGSIRLTDEWPRSGWDALPAAGGRIHFHATPDSIRHRYALHPFRRYRYGVWSEGGRVRGIVVDRPARLGPARGASLLAVYGDDVEALLRGWVASLGRGGVDFVHFLATPYSSALAVLEAIGTCWSLPVSRSPYYLTVKPLRPEFERALTRFDEWDCIGGSIL